MLHSLDLEPTLRILEWGVCFLLRGGGITIKLKVVAAIR